jgi:predicted metal-dependent hydrolase
MEKKGEGLANELSYRIEFWEGAQRAQMMHRREKERSCQKAGMTHAFCHCSL